MEKVTLKDSTLLAVNTMKKWADYLEVFAYMKENGFYIGNSKTPEKSVSSELYKHAESRRIERKKEGPLPKYRSKE